MGIGSGLPLKKSGSTLLKKYLISYLLLSLLPLVAVETIIYTAVNRIYVNEKIAGMKSYLDGRISGIRLYMEGKKHDANGIATNPRLLYALGEIEQNGAGGISAGIRDELEHFYKDQDFENILLVNNKGKIIYSASKTHVLTITESETLKNSVEQSLSGKKTELTGLEYYPSIDRYAMFVTVPILSGKGEVKGVVVLRIGNSDINELSNDYAGLGKTGETVVAIRQKEEALIITNLRNDPGSAFSRRVIIGSHSGIPIQNSSLGKTGSGRTVDYRGHVIIGAWGYIPESGWGIVVKQDYNEAMAPVMNILYFMLMAGFLMSVLIIISAIRESERVSKPIAQLAAAVGKIADGDFEAVTVVKTGDEIEDLAGSFGNMAVKLRDREEELNKTMEDLKRSNSDLEQFAYISSHDLQEPLRSITGYLQLMERKYKGRLDNEADEFINSTVAAAERMKNIISDILEYSRIDRKGGNFEVFESKEAVAQALLNLESAILDNKAKVICGPMPAIYGDSGQISRIFQNLIGNAVKFKGADDPVIEISAAHEGNENIFCVKDNGLGIEPQYYGKVFAIFQRLHSRREYPGTGIGLSICKKITERHGGRIWIESVYGKGSKFFFTIPDRRTR